MTSNITNVLLPPGTSNHGDPRLVCFPAKWSDIATFFVGNYVAHAATIVSRPGQPVYHTFLTIVTALLFPVTGVRVGFQAIFSRANLQSTDLRKAARAGALCRVVALNRYARTIREYSLTEGPSFLRINIHGRITLPNDYGLAILPPNSRFKDDKKEQGNTTTISSDWSFLKIIVSIAQLLFAVATLYRTKGDQIDQFGYAAFGLTVIPYALMSLVNLIGHLMCPQYPTMYLIQTTTMVAAQQEGAEIEGIIGILDEDIDNVDLHAPKSGSFWKGILTDIWWLPLWWSPLAITLGIIAALTRFQKGNSTQIERILTMAWLAMGFWFGAAGGLERRGRELKAGEARGGEPKVGTIYMSICFFWIVFLIGAIPVVAGFWVVANEIMSYGVCTRTI